MAEQRFVEVSLQRSGSDVPWGFRLSENSRFPTVVRVSSSGVSANIVYVGDLILKIGQNFTEGRHYSDVLQMIKNEGNFLTLTIDRGGPPQSLWSSTTSATESLTSPMDGHRPAFDQSFLRSTEPQNRKPFTYTSAPQRLAEELQMRHDAMRKERQQNLANTAAARSRMGDRTDSPSLHQMGNKAVMAGMPRFTLSDPKDFTQSDVYRLIDSEAQEEQMRNVSENNSAQFPQPGPSSFTDSAYSTSSSYVNYSSNEPSVRFDENVTQFSATSEDEDFDVPYGEVANYQQKSIRYLGKNNPSKTFKMLQSLIGDGDDQNGQMKAPINAAEGMKSSMRSVKSRAAQRKQAGGASSAQRYVDNRNQPPANVPTSPLSGGYQGQGEPFHASEERRLSYTDF